MKFLYKIFLLCLVTNFAIAQKALVPYRVGKLFGLSDEKGKIVITPAYENLYWMTGGWFRASKKVLLKDTLETAPGRFHIRNHTIKVISLIHNNKVILSDEPFNEFEIIAGKCIAAKFDGRGTDLTKEHFKKYGNVRKFYSLFNMEGKNLYPGNFKSIRKMDTAGVSSKNKNESRYILFWVEGFNNKHSLLVFDADVQAVSDWLVKDAYKLKPDRYRTTPGQLMVDIIDSNKNSSVQLLDYTNGKFTLQPTTAIITNPKKRREEKEVVEAVSLVGADPGDYRGETVAVPEPGGEEGTARPAPKFNPYHTFAKDSLFYITSYENRIPVQLPPAAKIIRMVPLAMTQYQPVIIIADNHFYIVKDNHLGETAYDSLIYFGQNFLAWKKVGDKTKAGVISNSGAIIIPFQYDSLYAGIRYAELVDKNLAADTPNYQLVFKEADSKYSRDKINPYVRSHTNLFTVFIKDKCAVVNFKNDIVIPFKYQMIVKNSMGHSRPREDEFVILKDNGRYGLTNLQYDSQKKQEAMNNTIEPIYEYLPGFYYPGYFGIKGYRLIGLYNEQNNFMGYATENGKTFYREQ